MPLQYNNQSHYSLNHVGSFLFLLLLSLLRPSALLPNLSFSLSPIALLSAIFLLLLKINNTIGFRSFWERFKLEIVLVISYQLLCVISLYSNLHRYENLHQIIKFGVTPILVQGMIPIVLTLFLLPRDKKMFSLSKTQFNHWILLTLALLISFMAFWQVINNNQAFSVYKFFIAGNIQNAENVRSIFAISTDLGAIAAVVLIFSALMALHRFRDNQRVAASVYALIAFLYLISGILSEARVFLLISSTGFLIFTLALFRGDRRSLAYTVVIGILCSLCLVQVIPNLTAAKLTDFLPVIKSLNLGIAIIPTDFIPIFDKEALGDRAVLWSSALKQIIEHPFIGISNGGFRLLNEALGGTVVNNTHNVFIQSAIDGGLGATIILTILISRAIKKSTNRTQLTITVSCIVGLLVDNFTDHSLPWIIITTYIAAVAHNQFGKAFKVEENSLRIYRSSIAPLLCIALLVINIAQYSIAYSNFSQLPTNKKVEEVMPFVIGSNFSPSPAFVTRRFADKFDSASELLKLMPIIEIDELCEYQYSKAYVFTMASEQQYFDGYQEIASSWGTSRIPSSECEQNNHALSSKKWTGNNRPYIEHWLKNSNETEIKLIYDNIVLYSPTFSLNSGGKLSFQAKGNTVNDSAAILFFELLDGSDNLPYKSKQIVLSENEKMYSIDVERAIKTAFIRVRLIHYQMDESEHQYHRANLSEFTFEPY